MEYIYHFAHIGLETWEKEPIKVIIGFEIWFLVCLLVAWGSILEIEGQNNKTGLIKFIPFDESLHQKLFFEYLNQYL